MNGPAPWTEAILSVIIIWEDRRPRLSRQTGFQPVSLPTTRFDMPNNRITHYDDGEYSILAKSKQHGLSDTDHPTQISCCNLGKI
jgi:hypothetical protein